MERWLASLLVISAATIGIHAAKKPTGVKKPSSAKSGVKVVALPGVSTSHSFASALPQRNYTLSWPQVWESGAPTNSPRLCDAQELQTALSFLTHTFEDVELHITHGSYIGFLGAVLEPPGFGRPGPLQLAVLPGLPGSLQIALTMLGVGLLDARQAGSLAETLGPGTIPRIPLAYSNLEAFTAPSFVRLARERLGVGPKTDLNTISQQELERAMLWQSADELRRFQRTKSCGARFSLVELRGAAVNALHGYATNYYHFVTEQMPSLLLMHAELSGWLPDNRITVLYLGQQWQTDYMLAAGFKEQQLRPYDPCAVYRADLVYTGAVPDSKAAELLLQTRAAILDLGFRSTVPATSMPHVDNTNGLPACFGGGKSGGRRILVLERRCELGSDGKCSGEAAVRGRSITNNDAVISTIKEVFGQEDGSAICVFRAEEHSVVSQALHFEAADVVIAAIGAGMTNLLYMRPGGLVIALHPAHPTTSFSVYSSRCGQSYFWHMASQLGLQYRAFLCPEMTVFDGGRVDTDDLKKFLYAEALPALGLYSSSRRRHVADGGAEAVDEQWL